MTKKTIEQLELMIRREVMRLEKSFTEDYLINSRTVNILSERVRAIEGKDIVLLISNILAKCDFCHNNTYRYKCLKNMTCSTCIYNFLNKRLTDMKNENKKGSGNT